MATSWYKYSGTGSTDDPRNYAPVSGYPNCPTPKQVLCAIFAEAQILGGEDRPVITSNLNTQINTAISTHAESPDVRLKSRS